MATGKKKGRPKGRKNRPGHLSTTFTAERKDLYFKELEKHGEPPIAREVIGVSHTTISRHRKEDENFTKRESQAMETYRSKIAAEIHRRGIDGWLEPVFQGGVKVGAKIKFSDVLLLAQARRHIPEYREKMQIDQTTKVEGDLLGLSLEQLSPKSRRLLRQIIEQESNRETEDK